MCFMCEPIETAQSLRGGHDGLRVISALTTQRCSSLCRLVTRDTCLHTMNYGMHRFWSLSTDVVRSAKRARLHAECEERRAEADQMKAHQIACAEAAASAQLEYPWSPRRSRSTNTQAQVFATLCTIAWRDASSSAGSV